MGGAFSFSTITSDVGFEGMSVGSFDLKDAVVLGKGGGILANLFGGGAAGLGEKKQICCTIQTNKTKHIMWKS